MLYIKQPTTIGHMWRITRGHNTLETNPLLICNLHVVHENDEPQPSKVFERYYKMSTFKKLPNWTGHLITCHQYTHPPKQENPCYTWVPVSHTECQPQEWVYFNYTPILEWSTGMCISKNGHQKNTCQNNIGRRFQILSSFLDSIVSIFEETYMTFWWLDTNRFWYFITIQV